MTAGTTRAARPAIRRRRSTRHAVRVTRANASLLALWVGGEVVARTGQLTVAWYGGDGVTSARQGDWIVREGDDFYTLPDTSA